MNNTTKIMDILGSNLDQVKEQLDPGLFISALIAALIAAFVASFLYRFFYERRGTGSQVHRAFPLLAVAVTTLFIGVQISIPLSLGLLGSLSIIRFRTPIKEPEEVGFIMLVIAASISAATFNFVFIIYMYIAAIIGLIVMRGAASLRWLKRDGLLIVTLTQADAEAKYKEIDSYLHSKLGRVVLENSSTHAGLTTYQFVFSSMDKNIGEFQSELSKIADFSSINIFLDRPGGVR